MGAVHRIVLFGPPGAGKGTQGALLERRLGAEAISTGAILRAEVEADSTLGRRAKRFLDVGQLVPDELMVNLIESRLAGMGPRENFLLDGFPRTVSQAEALAALLDRLARPLTRVLALKVDPEDLVRRLTGRRICPECGATYHVAFNPPQQSGVCDACGYENLRQRDDDKEEVIRQRLEVFERQTAPVIDWYRRHRLLSEVDGRDGIDAVQERLLAALGPGTAGGRRW